MSEEKKVNLPPKIPIDPFRIKLTPEMMLPADREEREQLIQMRESTTYWKDAMRRLRANKVAMISIVIIAIINWLLCIALPEWQQTVKSWFSGLF